MRAILSRFQDVCRVTGKVIMHPVRATVPVQVLFLQEYKITDPVIEQIGGEGKQACCLVPVEINISGLFLAQLRVTIFKRDGRQMRTS